MKWPKIAGLLLLVLAAMRLASWGLGWVAARISGAGARTSSFLSNGVAYLVYLALLYRDLEPGEPPDWNAVWFGLAVFTVYAGIDLYWTPWSRKKKA